MDPTTHSLLCISSNEAHLAAWRALLRDDHLDMKVSTSEDAALELIHSSPPQVVLVDRKVGEVDGATLCRRLSSKLGEKSPRLALIVAAEAGEDQSPETHVDLYIEESLAPHMFVTNLRALLRLASAEEMRHTLITQAEMGRVAAETAMQTKDEFLALVSHEIRTPLNAILGWSQVLRTSISDADVATHASAAIERNALMQKKLINDLLDHSRITRGALRLEVAPVNLGSVVEAACDAVRPAAAAKSIELVKTIDPTVGEVVGDADRLQQAVWNLLSNAVKFTPAKGRVEVRLERVDPHATITVTDTGKGIAEQFLPHVFEQYRQSDEPGLPKHSGLGLGLTLARRIVELHGGSIHAASGGVGLGATFRINLPVPAVRLAEGASAPRPAMDEEHSESANLHGLWILVVDDEPDARDLLDIALQQYGAVVTTAASAAEAFAIVSEGRGEQRPDLLISDIGMPVESGYDLIERIRTLPPERGGMIPAIAVTAFSRPSDRSRALAAGFQRHVSKPTDPTELALVAASLSGR
jgi:signal transduction histidine kinase/ActR/RegA family two-component response regulator